MKNLSIRLKLILLVALGLVFVSAVVVIGTLSNGRIKNANDQNIAALAQANTEYRQWAIAAQQRLDRIQDVLKRVQYARIAEKSYFQFYNPKYETQLGEHVNQALDVLKTVEKNKAVETLTTTLQAYGQDFGKIVTLHRRIEGLNDEIIGQFKLLKEVLSKAEKQIIANRFELQMQGDELSSAESHFETMVAQTFRTVDFLAAMRSQYLLTDNPAYIETLSKHFKNKMGGETASIRQTAKALKVPLYKEAAQKYKEIIYRAFDQTLETRDLFIEQKEMSDRLNAYGTVLTRTGNSFLKRIAEKMGAEQAASAAKLKEAKETRMDALARVRKTVFWVLVITLVSGAAISLFLAIVIIRSITGPIKTVIRGLRGSADDVTSASSQMSAASHRLAEGASEQAATIEETSSSLEEMSSMTKQNASNANQADGLMQDANTVVRQANDSMAHLIVSMKDISTASEETSKIIKTIDEIAFQTNLLALNAAVEAARAGEAGAGFAVVADEVRNLAMRAADAARETAKLIEGTVKKVDQGEKLVTTTNEAFVRVAESASKVGELVGEISAASNEQALGIEQINQAVVEMDKVVQQNAATAEESASSSSEMSEQAEQMKSLVQELATVVDGVRDEKSETLSGEAMPQSEAVRTLARPEAPPVFHPGEKGPGDMLPLTDDDFSDF
jgi:methyl-accepting chemotaxis protein